MIKDCPNKPTQNATQDDWDEVKMLVRPAPSSQEEKSQTKAYTSMRKILLKYIKTKLLESHTSAKACHLLVVHLPVVFSWAFSNDLDNTHTIGKLPIPSP